MPDPQSLRILVVDDEPSIRRLLRVLLKRAGHSVEVASNGGEGFAAVSEDPKQFDLIITDHEMPIAFGDEFVRCLRAKGFAGAILVCSAYLTPDLTNHYLELGVRECLSKPVAWEELRDRIAVIAASTQERSV